MYGCNKLYCEHLGRYFTSYYRQLGALSTASRLDFRVAALPRAHLGGHGPHGRDERLRARDAPRGRAGEALHVLRRAATRRSRSWRCRTPSARSSALLEADRERLTQTVYNVGAFSVSAARDREAGEDGVPRRGHHVRARSGAREDRRTPGPRTWTTRRRARDWKWAPAYDFERAFDEYLVPSIRPRYAAPTGPA